MTRNLFLLRQARSLIPAGRRPFRRLSAKSRSLCGILSILICAIVPAGAQQPQQPSQPVGTVYAERKPIAKTLDFVGRIEARERVVVQARVKGYLEAVLFKEGEFVKKGDALYQIEKGLFQAAVDDAQGALERAKAAKALTTVELQRKEELLEKQAGTVAARDVALAGDEQAKGAIPGAVRLPRGILKVSIDQITTDKERKLVLYCGGGSRSTLAALNLKKMGFRNVFSLAGGYREWREGDTL